MKKNERETKQGKGAQNQEETRHVPFLFSFQTLRYDSMESLTRSLASCASANTLHTAGSFHISAKSAARLRASSIPMTVLMCCNKTEKERGNERHNGEDVFAFLPLFFSGVPLTLSLQRRSRTQRPRTDL